GLEGFKARQPHLAFLHNTGPILMLSTPAIPSIDKNKLREVLITVSGALAGTAIALGSLVLALYLTDRPAGRGSLAVASSLISLAFIVVGAHLYATAKSLRRTPGRPLWGELITPPIYFLTAILIASVTP